MNFLKHVTAVFLAVLTISIIGHLNGLKAQNPDITPSQETFVGSHSNCSLSVSGTTKECKAGDGVWISENGGAYFHVQPSSTGGVTSLNGKTGDLTVSAVSAAPVATTTNTAPAVTVSVK